MVVSTELFTHLLRPFNTILSMFLCSSATTNPYSKYKDSFAKPRDPCWSDTGSSWWPFDPLVSALRCWPSCWWAQSSMWGLHPLWPSPGWTRGSACGPSASRKPAGNTDKGGHWKKLTSCLFRLFCLEFIAGYYKIMSTHNFNAVIYLGIKNVPLYIWQQAL